MSYVFPPPPTASVTVAGSQDRLPVRRIFCVGRNYASHALEMGGVPEREPPFFFTKPADAVIDDGTTIPYPPETENLHHEAELVVALGKSGRNVSEDDALDYVWGYAVGNDLTRRDLQNTAKEMRRPWDWAKAFDRSAPIAPIHSAEEVGHLASGAIRLSVNGDIRQEADLAEMVWSVPEIVAYLTRSIEVAPGDLIMTGTPAGVGVLVPGDVCQVEIERLGSLTTTIGQPA